MNDVAEPTAAAKPAAAEQPSAADRKARQDEERLAKRKERATALCAEIDTRFKELAEKSRGAMVYRNRTDHYGRVTATLTWREPGPPRELWIYVNPLEGMMEWSWVVNRVAKKGKRIEAPAFDEVQLNDLVATLTDQESWAKGPPPV